jgi:hypothetical protein
MAQTYKIYSHDTESLFIQAVSSDGDIQYSIIFEDGDSSVSFELSGKIDPDDLIKCANSLRQFEDWNDIWHTA